MNTLFVYVYNYVALKILYRIFKVKSRGNKFKNLKTVDIAH